MEKYISELTHNPLILALVTAIILDTVLGFLRAVREKKFNSTVGINGAIRKAGMLVCVIALGFADVFINIDLLFMLPEGIRPDGMARLGLCGFFALLFSLYEAASVLKNMVLCGLPVPKKIKGYVSRFLTAVTDELPENKEDINND